MNPSDDSRISVSFIPKEVHFFTMEDFNWRKKFPYSNSFVSLSPVGVADIFLLFLTNKDTKKQRHLQLFVDIFN